MPESSNKKRDGKWGFEDYAFTITGIIVGVLLVVPEILYSQFGISILGGGLAETAAEMVGELEYGYKNNPWDVSRLRALSPLLFLLTTTIVFFKDAFDARKNGGYKGSMFTHTFESLLEDAIYMLITTMMVYGSVLVGAMYASWLAGPVAWILFIFIFPAARKKRSDDDRTDIPWFLLFIFVIGVIIEIMVRTWLAFPLAWLIICALKLINTIRKDNHSIDTVFNILYYAFSVIFMALGIGFGFWIVSWVSFPIALFICWVINKFWRFKNEAE